MEGSIQILPSIKDKYIKVRYLINEQAQTDPENEPYKSKYEARDLLHEIEDIINGQLNDSENNLKDILAIIYCMISNVSYDVEEITIGNEYANKAVDLISHNPLHPSRVITMLTCLNNLGYWSWDTENFKSKQEYLERAESIYNQYNSEVSSKPNEWDMLVTGESNLRNESMYEKCYTQTLFYLAQVYSKQGDPTKSAKYCHTTLQRQLKDSDMDVIDWSLNAATLSQFLIERNAFREARHHLAASLLLLKKHSLEVNELLIENETEEMKAKSETVRHRLADVYRCWAKYSIFLLNASKERLLRSQEDNIDPIPEPPDILKGLKFESLPEEELVDLERMVTCDFILTYEDAKPLFKKSQEWLTKAKEYYSLEDHASEYSSIIQDSSKLYHLLAFFQDDEGIQCKLHKRRLDMLTLVVKELNPKYYLKICREIWYEIGEICMAMADIKTTKAKESEEGSTETVIQHNLSKIKHLTLQGIKYLEDFVQSFVLKSNSDKYPEEFEKTIILAYMFLGHMYTRVNESDKSKLIKLQEESVRCYKAILDYCNLNEEAKQSYPEEYSISKEMVELIPLKITRLKALCE